MSNLSKRARSASESLPCGVLYKREERKANRPQSGFIFLCNNRTERECLDGRVFGLPESMKAFLVFVLLLSGVKVCHHNVPHLAGTYLRENLVCQSIGVAREKLEANGWLF